MESSSYKHMEVCPVCGERYQFGPHSYEGHRLEAYDMRVCDGCEVGNHDGWAPHHEATLLEHLKTRNLPEPERLENGMLPFNP